MGRKNKKPTPKPPSPTVSSDNDVISATSSSQHDTVPPTPPPKPTTTTTTTASTPTIVVGLTALPPKRPATSNASENKPKKLKSAEPTTGKPDPISEEDDIVILKGFIDYMSQNGVDPLSNIDDFFDFVKPSLKLLNVDKGLIVNKVQQLKTKFRHPKKKKDPTPHEIQSFKLSEAIWGKPEVIKPVHAEENAIGGNDKEKERVEEEEGVEDDVTFGFSREGGEMVREMMKVMEGEERKEFRNTVKKASVAYLDAYLLRLKVLEVAARKVSDHIRDDEL